MLKTDDLIELVKLLAGSVTEMSEARGDAIALDPEECKEAMIMKFPIIQGTRNRMNLKAIGERGYDKEAAAREFEYITRDKSC